MMAKKQSSDLALIPKEWPGGFGLYEYSKRVVKVNLEPFIVVLVLNAFLGVGFSVALKNRGDFLSFILSGLFGSAAVIILLRSARGKKVGINKSFSEAVQFWVNYLVLQMLIGLTLIGSLLLLVVPFFYVLPRLVLAKYFLIDKDMGIMEAYKASWHSSKGHSGKVWRIFGVNFAMMLLMLTVIGIPFAIYFLVMYQAAFALLYLHILKHKA